MSDSGIIPGLKIIFCVRNYQCKNNIFEDFLFACLPYANNWISNLWRVLFVSMLREVKSLDLQNRQNFVSQAVSNLGSKQARSTEASNGRLNPLARSPCRISLEVARTWNESPSLAVIRATTFARLLRWCWSTFLSFRRCKDLVVFRFHVSVESLCRAPSGLQFGPTVVAFRLTAISIAKEVAPDH